MRLLDKQAGRLNMTHLGLIAEDYERLKTLVHRPHGIILVTGPTGSGKTTTLYAALSDLNDGSRNILTAEDPIEYQLEGIGQTQVNTKVDMTFARALKLCCVRTQMWLWSGKFVIWKQLKSQCRPL